MKEYQQHHPIYDAGKAAPHPKRPTSYTYRGAGGRSISVDPILLRAKRQKMGAPKKKGGAQRHIGIVAALIALITPRKAARNR